VDLQPAVYPASPLYRPSGETGHQSPLDQREQQDDRNDADDAARGERAPRQLELADMSFSPTGQVREPVLVVIISANRNSFRR